MGEKLLNALIGGSVDYVNIVNAIKDDCTSSNLFSEQHPGDYKDDFSIVKDFVPCFLNFVKSKLSRNLSEQQLASCSPKRSASFSSSRQGKIANSRTNLSARFSNQDAKSKINKNGKQSKSFDSFVSSKGKQSNKKGSERRSHSAKKQTRIEVQPNNSVSDGSISQRKPASGSYNNENLTMNISSPLTSTPQVNRQVLTRRITPTLVNPQAVQLQENTEIKSLFESSPVIESSESSIDSSGSSISSTPFDRKIKHLEKSMRNRNRQERAKIPLSMFLNSSEDRGDTNKNVRMPFKPIAESLNREFQNLDCSPIIKKVESNQSKSTSFDSNSNDVMLKDQEDFISTECISDKAQLHAFIEIYKCILFENLMSNFCIELYFLFSVVNCKFEKNPSKEMDEVIFESAESCIYFAAKVLDGIKSLIVILDKGTLLQITQNKRLQFFAPNLIEFVEKELNETGSKSSSSIQIFNTSNSLGVPFLAEGNNRKAFLSDRHFYSFSKMRDKFYGLIRTWEENHFNQDWNIERELSEKFEIFFFEFSEFPTYAQFSQLFVAQLIELSSQDASGMSSRDGNISISLLTDLKATNPMKFQRLQERFFSPMTSHGPCPKPCFSNVETFFKLFIDKSCNYVFLVHLKDTLISRLLEINSHNFQDHTTNEEEIDEAESITNARNEFSVHLTEARILARFLGHVVFSPYELDSRSRSQAVDCGKQEVIIQPFDPYLVLHQSQLKGCLLITVPWLVLYLSMMDEFSLKRHCNLRVLQSLASLYRLHTFRLNNANISLNALFILLQLGWLFEQPLISASTPFYQMITCITVNQSNQNKQCLDSRSIITKAILIRFCPYLSEIKSVLSSAGAGTVRKITPLTHTEKATTVDSRQQLKEKMIQDFFKYKPKHFKETTDFIIERFCNIIKTKGMTEFIPKAVQNAVGFLEKNVIIEQNQPAEIEELKKKNAPYFKQITSSTKLDLLKSFHLHSDEHCANNTNIVLSNLLPDDVHEKVVETAAKIISYEVKQKIIEWVDHKMTEAFQEELNAAYSRLLMGELKRHNKSLNESQ